MPAPSHQLRDPGQLTVHPAIRHIPPPSPDELRAIQAGLSRTGEWMPPILLDVHGQILTDFSRTHWLCAQALKLSHVPVCERHDLDVHVLAIRDLAHRRHFSKSAVAYLAVPHLEEAFAAARRRMLAQLRKGPNTPGVPPLHSRAETIEDLAEGLGISRRLLFAARTVHRAFEDQTPYTFIRRVRFGDRIVRETTLKEWFEPQLLRADTGAEPESAPPLGLGAVLAGIAAAKSGPPRKFKYKPRPRRALYRFEHAANIFGAWPHWLALSQKDRQQHYQNVENLLSTAPSDQRAGLADYFETMAAKCRRSLQLIATPARP